MVKKIGESEDPNLATPRGSKDQQGALKGQMVTTLNSTRLGDAANVLGKRAGSSFQTVTQDCTLAQVQRTSYKVAQAAARGRLQEISASSFSKKTADTTQPLDNLIRMEFPSQPDLFKCMADNLDSKMRRGLFHPLGEFQLTRFFSEAAAGTKPTAYEIDLGVRYAINRTKADFGIDPSNEQEISSIFSETIIGCANPPKDAV